MLNASETSLFPKKGSLFSVAKGFFIFINQCLLVRKDYLHANPDRVNHNPKSISPISNLFYHVKSKISLYLFIVISLSIIYQNLHSQSPDPAYIFKNPPESAKPWVFWYWMHAAVTKDGITADLEALKDAGIGGAYIFTIKGVTTPPLIDPPVEQLTPEWWDILKFTLSEAGRLGLKIGFHACDGFTTAGGPWITPELSMQRVVWSDTIINGGRLFDGVLPKPESNLEYYKDIAVFAIPVAEGQTASSYTAIPIVTTSIPGADAQFLTVKGNRENFRSNDPCWIQYTFFKPFTCRSVKIISNGNNLQSLRLKIETSNDGKNFTPSIHLNPPRHGWQDAEADHTFAIPPVTARYFRFLYDKEDTEPGSEDYDAAKWKQSLKICGIELSAVPLIHQYEGKSGAIWRISPRTTLVQLLDSLCVPLNNIMNVSDKTDSTGHLRWNIPEGHWRILRMGHTTTGHTNYIGGAGKGLECDKFNPDIVRIQFDNWFGKLLRISGADPNQQTLKVFHVDSWECGSQNWSTVFREEFLKRHGYDLMPYLPVFAGIPVENADVSERVLYDIRNTIAELITENFFGTFASLAHENGCIFSAENSSPVMVSDAMKNFEKVDIPMGEFWHSSPTHDKPSDILDAVSAAHIYGKSIIQAEAFTTLRMTWKEHPDMLKTLGDRNYALGINRFVYHVYTHNPWLDRKPGMTLDGVGLCFQRDQTWWKYAKSWVDYQTRCQALLQLGKPVVDIAVFTGEEISARALTPDRLITTLPGLFGNDRIEQENTRLANTGLPIHEMPKGVSNSVNTYRPEFWTDPLRGYHYDSFNKDALLKHAKVNNGRVEFADGMSYGVLVFPGSGKMTPDGNLMSAEVAAKIFQLLNDGATIIISELSGKSPGFFNYRMNDSLVNKISLTLFSGKEWKKTEPDSPDIVSQKIGNGLLIKAPYTPESFESIEIQKDLVALDNLGKPVGSIAWTHRRAAGVDIYFISNQENIQKTINFSLRISGYIPELYDPVSGDVSEAQSWEIQNNRTIIPLQLEPGSSLFILFQKPAGNTGESNSKNWPELKPVQQINGNWMVKFDTSMGGPEKVIQFKELTDWSKHSSHPIRHYSGTATYKQNFKWKSRVNSNQRIWLDFTNIANIAEVRLNNELCGVLWTPPYRINITGAIKKGRNDLEVKVTNTWANRLIGDHALPEDQRVTWTTAPYRLEGDPLTESGLTGTVKICISE